MKKLLALLTVCSIFQGIYGQILNYPLSSYKTPDYKFQSLEFKFNSTGNSGAQNYSQEFVDNSYQNNTTFQSVIAADYNFINYTHNKQSGYSAHLNTDQSYYGSKDNKAKNRGFGISESLYLAYNQNKYFTEKFFYGFKSGFSFSNNSTNRKITSENIFNITETEKSVSSYSSVYVSAGFNIGVGRIEDISSATNAIFLLEGLQKNGFITGDVDHEKITLLANKIAILKQSRFLDSRLNRIKQIEQVDSLLREKNIILDNSASYFANLVDQWDYIKLNNNFSGESLIYSIDPNISYKNQKYTQNETVVYKNSQSPILSVDQTLTYRNKRPINLHWSKQFIAGIGFACYYERNKNKNNYFFDNDENVSEAIYTDTRINANYSYSYTPNTRTYFTFGTQLSYINQMDFSYDDKSKNNNKGFRINGGLFGNAEYYLSPRFLLSGSANLSYSYQDKDNDMNFYYYKSNNNEYNWKKSNEFNLDYSISLVYKFM